MLQNSPEFNSVGGGFGGFGGFGGIAPVGLIGLNNLFNRDGKECDGNANAPLFIQKSIYDAKDSLNEAIDSVRDNMDGRLDSLKDALTSRIENVGDAVCESEKTTLTQFYQAALQAQANTTSIKDQNTQFFIANDSRFDALTAAGVSQTAAILARINDAEVQRLRDELNHSHRRNDAQDIEIKINNSANAVQAQAQGQFQVQTQRDNDLNRRFDAFIGSFNQLNRNTQDVINFGTMAASANQANSQTNIK